MAGLMPGTTADFRDTPCSHQYLENRNSPAPSGRGRHEPVKKRFLRNMRTGWKTADDCGMVWFCARLSAEQKEILNVTCICDLWIDQHAGADGLWARLHRCLRSCRLFCLPKGRSHPRSIRLTPLSRPSRLIRVRPSVGSRSASTRVARWKASLCRYLLHFAGRLGLDHLERPP